MSYVCLVLDYFSPRLLITLLLLLCLRGFSKWPLLWLAVFERFFKLYDSFPDIEVHVTWFIYVKMRMKREPLLIFLCAQLTQSGAFIKPIYQVFIESHTNWDC